MDEVAVGLKIIAESIHVQAKAISFRCAGGGGYIECQMTALALCDLIEFHGLRSLDDGALESLLPEIERLVNAKLIAGRLEENGELSIRESDLLRYGYRERRAA